MNAGRIPLVVANWKMNKTPREAAAFISELLGVYHTFPPSVQLAIAPAFPSLERVGRLLDPTAVLLAAQDVYTEAKGAFTGEVSAAMLKDLNVAMALVGHSDRRRERGEDETDFSRKIKRLAEAGIAPLYCVGETLDQRDAGDTERVLTTQLEALALFGNVPPAGLALAYEPVWAIGTGRSATPDTAASAHRHLRACLAERFGAAIAGVIRVVYGGSVAPENAAALFAQEEVDGALVGGASLTVPDFCAIVRAAG